MLKEEGDDKMKSPDDEIIDPESQAASLKYHSPTVHLQTYFM